MQSVNNILDRLRNAYDLSSDAKLAHFLGVKPSTISSWRGRNSIDFPLIFEKCVDINANWVVNGEGPIWKDDLPRDQVEEGSFEYLTDRVRSFQNRAAALLKEAEEGPYPPDLKLQMIESLIKISKEEFGDKLNDQKDIEP